MPEFKPTDPVKLQNFGITEGIKSAPETLEVKEKIEQQNALSPKDLNDKKFTSLTKRLDNLNNIENVRKELGLTELEKETTDIIARQKMKIQEELTGMEQQTTETKNSQKNSEKMFDNPEDDPRFKEIDKEINMLVEGKVGPEDDLNTQMAIRTNAKISVYNQFYKDNLQDAEKYIQLGDDKYKDTDLFPSWYTGLKEAKRRTGAENIFSQIEKDYGVTHGATLKINGELWEVTNAKNIGIELKSKNKDNLGHTFSRTIYPDQFNSFLEELKQSETLLEEVKKGEPENINPEILESNERVPIESKEEALSDNPLVIEKKVEDTSTNADQVGNDILLEPNQNPLRKVERKETKLFDTKKIYTAVENMLIVFDARARKIGGFDIMPQKSFDKFSDLYKFMTEKVIGKDPKEDDGKIDFNFENDVSKEMLERFEDAMDSLEILPAEGWNGLGSQEEYFEDLHKMRDSMGYMTQELAPFAKELGDSDSEAYQEFGGRMEGSTKKFGRLTNFFEDKIQTYGQYMGR